MLELIKNFWEDKKKTICIVGIISFAIVAGIFALGRDNAKVLVRKADPGVSQAAYKMDTTLTTTTSDTIQVYVVGSVYHPGVVTLKKGQIIQDAINAAGGATKDADLENINLAYQLKDNLMIKISSKQESKQGLKSGIMQDSGGAVATGASGQNQKADSKININTATADQLDTLPGVGQTTADKIINYREANGSFKVIDDLMKVPGIGKSKFAELKNLITVN